MLLNAGHCQYGLCGYVVTVIVTTDLSHYYHSTLVITFAEKGACWSFPPPDSFFIILCFGLSPGCLISVHCNTRTSVMAAFQLGLTNGRKKSNRSLYIRQVRKFFLYPLFLSAVYFLLPSRTASHLADHSHRAPVMSGHQQYCFFSLLLKF